MLFLRQILALVYKNILIAFLRRPITTTLRALALPIFIGWFFSYARNFLAAPAQYGVGPPRPVLNFSDALALTGSRNKLVFVNNGFEGGQIEQIISEVGGIARNAGKDVQIIRDENGLLTECRNSLRGSSRCIAGVVFRSTPTEPLDQGLPYNYSLRFDGILGASIRVDQDNNDQQVLLLPLQKAIDRAIATVNGSLPVDALEGLEEFPFTAETQEQRNTDLRIRYMSTLIHVLGAAFFIGMCGVQYQQVGAQATERETKMAQLLEVMMPNKRRWEPQIARLLSYHFAFTILYLPGWIIMPIILKEYVFVRTSASIVIIYHILNGLSLASFSLFAAAFFKRAQLSGITTILLSLVLAVIAQVTPLGEGAVYALSLLFPSMNYVFFIVYMARFEQLNIPTNLTRPATTFPPLRINGLTFGGFLIVQIFVYPVLALIVERILWGTASGNRRLTSGASGAAVELSNFSKHFRRNWFERKVLTCFAKNRKGTVRAVDDLSLAVHPGQITLLLGANGSGKSTTLDAVAGLSKPTSGTIAVDFSHGIGFCPQQNVLWKDLTVYEHVKIFDCLKSIGTRATKEERVNLVKDCDLERKLGSKAGSLSGGQMRKLQLASMFIGKSKICLVDECSSGIDPLARRKVQEILLTERSRSQRTIMFTSHYLDEADIADYILIMSKGKLKMQGTAPQIKQSGQYQIHVYHTSGGPEAPRFEGISRREMYDQTIYTVEDTSTTSDLLTKIENLGIRDYTVSGPTVEDAFMRVAEEMVPANRNVVVTSGNASTLDPSSKLSQDNAMEVRSSDSENDLGKDLDLHTGTSVGPFRQGAVLFQKRCRVFLRNVYPNLAAFLIVPIAAGLTSNFLQGFRRAGCIPSDNARVRRSITLATALGYNNGRARVPFATPYPLNDTSYRLILDSLPTRVTNLLGSSESDRITSLTALTARALTYIDPSTNLQAYVSGNTTSIFPGAISLGGSGQPPTIAYIAENPGYVSFPVLLQNLVSILSYGNPIGFSYQPFAIPWQAGQGDTLQYTIYFGLVLSAAPAFFALYPTLERLRHVRGLHYSNGVRALPLWLSYTLFDFTFVLVAASISAIILFVRFNHIIFGLGHFWLVLVLYGLCATLCSYVVSLFAPSQLAAFAISAAYQAGTCLLYLITYLSLVTYADTNMIERNLTLAHFTLSLIMPSGSLFRSLFVSLNVLSINCRGSSDYVGSPGDITAYGGPILYLIVQSVLLFSFLVWWDSGNKFSSLISSKHRAPDSEEKNHMEPEVAEELERVTNATDDGLRVLHISKTYGKNLAVNDASFGVRRGEVFGLLGPNGAGKSTTISIIRGDVKASNDGGDVFIENVSLRKKRALARQNLSACPQYDAMDRLTVIEHLAFYARVRGVKAVKHNVDEIIRAVGLTQFKHHMGEKLSGGNKRKLSLGIALMGNPAVMLLDEPSSGMDVAAKRVMWHTLESVVAGRSIVLTTHSMEEADRLCNRAGILARSMLTVGTSDYLRKKHGDKYYVHLLLKSAPYTDQTEEQHVTEWIRRTFANAEIDEKSHHGQIRFSVPSRHQEDNSPHQPTNSNADKKTEQIKTTVVSGVGIAPLFSTLEKSKIEMGFEYYSVSHTTLDQVFLSIVTRHNIEEENAGPGKQRDGGVLQRVLGRFK